MLSHDVDPGLETRRCVERGESTPPSFRKVRRINLFSHLRQAVFIRSHGRILLSFTSFFCCVDREAMHRDDERFEQFVCFLRFH